MRVKEVLLTYAKDELTSLDISSFGRPDAFTDVDSECDKLVQIIESATSQRAKQLNLPCDSPE